MSTPVSNLDIEDVLSSIRKLVSDGERKVAKPAVPAAPEAGSRLVLTPAQRVDDLPQEAQEDGAEGDERNVDDVLSAIATLAGLATGPARDGSEDEQGAVEDDAPEEATTDTRPEEPETGAVSAANDDDAPASEVLSLVNPISIGDAAQRGAAQMAEEDGEAAESDPPMAADEPEEAEVASTPQEPEGADRSRLESKIAQLEAAVTSANEEFEPDGSEATPEINWAETEASAAAFFSSRTPRPVPSPQAEAPSDIVQEADVEEVAEAADVIEAAAEEIAAEEPSASEPEDATADAAPAQFSSDRARPAPVDVADVEEAEDEVYWDETALRRLVADVLREELQGELGERITRNVRKLVRREIARMIGPAE